jgi:hypothetical protein
MAAVAMPAMAQNDWEDEDARQRMEERRERQRMDGRRDRPRMQERRGEQRMNERRGRQGQQRRDRARMHTVEGEIQDLKTIRLMGMKQPLVIARLETEEGRRAKVALGQKNRLRKLHLSDGDAINVRGFRGTINKKGMLLARTVMKDGQSVDVKPPRARKMDYMKGEIQDLRTTTFRGRDGDYLVAKVKTDEGKTATVNMGRKNKLNKLNLSEGDTVHVLGRPGKMNDREAVIAARIHANETTVNVAPKKEQN